MPEYKENIQKDLMRQRRERYIIAALAVVIIILSYVTFNVFDLGLDLPISDSILIFALININVILLLLLLFLTLRNLVKLLFERRKGIMGARLRTKLVLAFIILSLLPAILLFYASANFIMNSIEYWYHLPIDRSLENSFEIGNDYYKRIHDEIITTGYDMSRLITYHELMLISRKDDLERFIREKRMEHHLSSIMYYGQKLDLRAISRVENIDFNLFKDLDSRELATSYEKGTDHYVKRASIHGDLLVSSIIPVFSRTETKAVVGLIVLEKFVPVIIANRIKALSKGLEEYEQLKLLKTPVKVNILIFLAIVTLIIIFVAVWLGFFLSKGIIVPIQELAEGTNRIASGDYDFSIDLEAKDEIGVLVNSFNRMTQDLRTSKKELEKANEELVKSNVESEKRRLYMEVVLANVASGVISADAEGRILTINKSAEKMLNIKAEDIIGKYYAELVSDKYSGFLTGIFKDNNLFRKGFIERQIRIPVGNKVLSLVVFINVLRDDRGEYLGLVAVFEDVSEIERAQRTAAWREVARRIAHEVKNPLTPVQLSAQRLKKRYGSKIAAEEKGVFEECTNMIINQVEALKTLVNEFSSFARMPASNPLPDDISLIIKEAVSVYKEAQKRIDIVYHDSVKIPLFPVDREQIKRVMINLIDNAIDAMGGEGEIVVDLSYDKEDEKVRIEVADTGKGISAEIKERLFEPYFSTKKEGTGLGLAIVNTIISDHKGFIRVEDNFPRGSKFIIELPTSI